jgi:hypothetical protein
MKAIVVTDQAAGTAGMKLMRLCERILGRHGLHRFGPRGD